MFETLFKFVLICVLLVFPSDQASTPDTPYYVAGVVEFHPKVAKYANDTSAPDYVNIINSKAAENVDILVFPELTLNTVLSVTYVPDPDELVVPCEDKNYFEEFFSSISCAARNTSKYIVVNVIEKENCTEASQKRKGDPRPCNQNGLTQYNTNVVFDRKGTVISRYRKWNLYGELGRNTTHKPEFGVFDTDFGVRFGHFICFDILFKTPALDLVARGITDFIFPSMWFSELPFLAAVQVQSSWAYTNNVNLLAAGANRASVGSTGSGIYAGKQGRIVAVMNSDPVQKLYVAAVPKKGTNRTIAVPNKNEMGSVDLFFKMDKLDMFNTTIVDPSENVINKTLCNGGLCCKFEAVLKNQSTTAASKSYTYRLAVYNGTRTYGVQIEGFVKVCGIISCVNRTLESCGTVFSRNVTVENSFAFENITIEGDFQDSRTMFFMPSSLDSTYMPLNVDEIYFQQTKSGGKTHSVYALTKPRSNLLTFATYVNVIDTKNSSSNGAVLSFVALIMLIAVSFH